MAGKITIYGERCKGCGLCVVFCGKGSIAISAKSNKKGYFPPEMVNSACTGCAICAIVCPEAAIEVCRDKSGRIRDVRQPDSKSRPSLVEEKS